MEKVIILYKISSISHLTDNCASDFRKRFYVNNNITRVWSNLSRCFDNKLYGAINKLKGF